MTFFSLIQITADALKKYFKMFFQFLSTIIFIN